jgi:cytoskeletal protein CcmA (bactofilin family)
VAFKGMTSEVSGAEVNLIGKGTVVNGEIHAESSIRIDGKLKGKLKCKSTVTVGQSGEIDGDMEANNANISGKIKGKVIVKQKLVLESTSSLVGELQASKLIVDEGAVFDGTSHMGNGDQQTAMPVQKNNKDIPFNKPNH